MKARALLQDATGLNLSTATCERAVRTRLKALGQANADDYLAAISAQELAALVELVVVPESWMFRDPAAFAAAVSVARERLAAGSSCVRILSIPCAGGEEPYSMAMALQDAGVPRAACRIEGIDLSAESIARARAAIYSSNAFRGRDLAFREQYFSQHGRDFRLVDLMRSQVEFKQGNILKLDIVSRMGMYDVIFCRNLLIYFDEQTAASAIANLRAILADNGVLFAGYAEVPAFCSNGFSALKMPNAFALQKTGARTVPASAQQATPETIERRRSMRQRAPSRALPPAQPCTPRRAAVPPAPALTRAAPDPATLLSEARTLADRGNLPEAAARCEAALIQDPSNADAYYILGLVAEIQSRPGVADDYWRRCIYLQPDHYDALCHLALLAEKHGDASGAASLRQRAARVYAKQGDA